MRFHRRPLLMAVVLALLPLTACEGDPSGAPPAADDLVVTTADGPVAGFRDAEDGVRVWRGIPFAAPPVGGLRWRPPADPGPWTDVRDSTEYGEPCLQGTSSAFGSGLVDIKGGSEDCLTLNVTRPETPGDGLPVMVWIHGGAFVHGSGSQPIYNSAALAARGIVLVTVNYRLGRLGFFAHPALDEKVANFGLLDQVQALEWVRDNIAGFGGDPENVTIFGESAGGMSVNALMASPAARGLFTRAISQSGLGREVSEDVASARSEGRRLMADLVPGRASAAALREVPAEDVMGLPVNLLVGDVPIVYGSVLPAPVSEVFESGREARVPFLLGTTDLEVPDLIVQQAGRDPDRERDRIVGENRAAAVAAYGGEQEFDRHLLSDVLFTEPARHLAELHASEAETYLYRFSITSPQLLQALGGAPHASEIPYVFDDTSMQPFPVEGSEPLADTIGDYWVAFATGGRPTADGAPAWAAYDRTRRVMMLTIDGPRMAPDPWTARLDAVEAGYDARRIPD